MREVVEREQHVRDHHREVGHPELVGTPGPHARLERAHQVVTEHPNGAARERRQPVELRQAVATELAGHGRVGVLVVAGLAVHGQAALVEPHDRPLLHPEERPAAKALTLLGRLEEERGALAAQLEVRRHGRLTVVDEAVAERDQGVLARELADLVQARGDLELGRISGDGH